MAGDCVLICVPWESEIELQNRKLHTINSLYERTSNARPRWRCVRQNAIAASRCSWAPTEQMFAGKPVLRDAGFVGAALAARASVMHLQTIIYPSVLFHNKPYTAQAGKTASAR